MKKGTARGLAMLGGLAVLGGFAAAAAASGETKKKPPSGAPPLPDEPTGPGPEPAPEPVPEPPPDIDEPEEAPPAPVPPPVSRTPTPEPEDEDEPPEATPEPRKGTAKVVEVRRPTPEERKAMEAPSTTLTVDSPKVRESTPAEASKAKVGPAPSPAVPPALKPPPPPPEPTAADYSAMLREGREREAAKQAAAPAPQPAPKAVIPAPVRKEPPGMDRAVARKLAPQVAANIDKKKYDYDRSLVQKFQTAAGLPADKIYGPETAMAVQFYGVRRPPKALFKGADGTTKPVPYRWAN